MKLSTILTASTLLGAFVSAAPLSALDPRVFQVGVKFFGADEGSYFDQTFPADGTLLKISTFLSHKKFISRHKFPQIRDNYKT